MDRTTSAGESGYRWQAGFFFVMVTGVVASLAQWSAQDADAAPPHQPQEVAERGYLSSDTCRACHPGHYTTWAASYHRTMTSQASTRTVLGAQDGGSFQQGSQLYRMHQQGDRLSLTVATAGDGSPGPLLARDARPLVGGGAGEGEHALSLVTGSHHMQILWYETGKGRKLGQFPFAYLTEDRRWVPRSMIFLRPPSPYTMSEDGRWNDTCLHCHTTRGQPRPDERAGFDTRVVEQGIACEACHGPGEAHVERYRSPLTRYRSYFSDDPDTRITNPSKLDPLRASQICSQCHALWQFGGEQFKAWSQDGMAYRPGDDAEQHMWLLSPSRADRDPRVKGAIQSAPAYVTGQYWSDGQARVSGREFHGMTDSACAKQGELSCMSCHRMHQAPSDPRPARTWANDQLDVGMDGDRACLQCHGELAGDLQAHTQHAPGSTGSRCYNCHMPYTSYGLLKAIRSHQITIPSASETAKTGRPNACNLCHLDRSLAWTAANLRGRFGVYDNGSTNLGDDASLPLSVVQALSGDAGQRALMAWAFGWQAARDASASHWAPAFLGSLLDDPYDAVRYVAERSLRRYPGYADLDYDYTLPPAKREPVAQAIAKMTSAAGANPVPAKVPLGANGQLNAVAHDLQSRRDDRPVQLLE